MTAQDRELWDALIFDAYENPTPDLGADGYSREALPLEERHTEVMASGDATSFRLCIQSPDESYTGQRLERYDPAWWRAQVERFTLYRWAGTIEVGTCTGEPPDGWVYVREGNPGELSDTSFALARTWRRSNPHGTSETWVRSEIIFHSEQQVRNAPESAFESTLAHELGHVLGLSHVPQSSGFVMTPRQPHTWPDKERWLSQWGFHVGPGVEYPGFGLPADEVAPLAPQTQAEFEERFTGGPCESATPTAARAPARVGPLSSPDPAAWRLKKATWIPPTDTRATGRTPGR